MAKFHSPRPSSGGELSPIDRSVKHASNHPRMTRQSVASHRFSPDATAAPTPASHPGKAPARPSSSKKAAATHPFFSRSHCGFRFNPAIPPLPTASPSQAHSVSVSSPPHQRSPFPAFRVPRQQDFDTSFDAVAALEETFPHLKIRNPDGTDLLSVLVPLDEESLLLLEDTALDQDAPMKLIKLDPQTNMTKAIVMGYPLRLPPVFLLRNPQVESATRCLTARTQDDTRQVLVTIRGPIPTSITIGNWGITSDHSLQSHSAATDVKSTGTTRTAVRV
ncbi:hypothetical protein GWK47_019883 [Chionoecetes opilio]|uniref:Uncharacterized protein n=1 Tax=Chionoecetes opilio TaxID=41210 RepID=A0A8J4XRU8_CHIOP|nr:hypothetical protein GWK47_019883 [Chionoecetes opilio]